MIRLIVTVLVLTVVHAGAGWPTPPTMEFPLDVENPSYYHQLVSSSSIPRLFPGCVLVEPGEPKYWQGSPEKVFLRQGYLTPTELSEFGVHYRLLVRLEIDHDTISGHFQLKERWANYAKCIAQFESNPAVHRFLEVTKPEELLFNGSQIYCGASSYSHISFDLDSAKFYYLFFRQPELIPSVCLFLPEVDSMAWFQEFRDEVGIGSVMLKDGKVTISQNQMCPTCSNHVSCFYPDSRLISFALSANHPWAEFPMIAYVRQIVRERLEGDSLGSCTIGSGDSHSYLMLSRNVTWRDQVEETWAVRVAINCRETPSRRDVCFDILNDSTIDGFRVCYDNERGRR